uniref:D-aminoacyl-tRNA deacylase n=1 Tax=Caldimicrobium thiodismutans TaxID=1653476 RepID=A0A832GP11_9BACT
MKALLQRVKEAKVVVENRVYAQIGKGLLALVCIEKGDDEKIVAWMGEKLVNLRIFPDEAGKFNLSVKDIGGEILLVSNFTLAGELKKGTRPSFHRAEEPERAKAMLQTLEEEIAKRGIKVKSGLFGAHMEIFLINDGPVTILLEKGAQG